MIAAKRHCRTLDEADDAVQDAALAAWRYGPGFRGDGRVDRWLVRLVATACNRLRRGAKRDASLHVSDEELASDDATPEMLATRGRLAEALGKALQELPPRDRTIILLSDGQGWTAPEIAEALSMTPGSVRTRLSRMHTKLRKSLSLEGVSAPGLDFSSIDR